ncbi:MAG: hypothetical protein QM754_18355 [Tepidisphaeraceae bacterium]
MSKEPQHRVQVGTQWLDAKGRLWTVFEVLPFGRCRVHTNDRTRVGEMQTSGIRREITAAINREAKAQIALDRA